MERLVVQLKAMHKFVCTLDDEDYYMWWIMVVPDEATEEDFIDIAEDEEQYNHVCDLFTRLVDSYYKKYKTFK